MKYAAFVALAALVAGSACSDDRDADNHRVFFVGYVYDGATGARLNATQLTAISVKYRDKVIRTRIEEDGRYVSLDPLPTWQDYAVYVGAPGYRAFVSRNQGFDVPSSLAMTEGLAGAGTTQTFHFDTYLFPVGLKTPMVVLTIEQADAATTTPTPPRAAGTIRLRPQSVSLLDRVTTETGAPTTRRWFNDEDLLAQTINRAFTDGRVELAEGELAYGVRYEIAVFDVKGYQPTVITESNQPFIAGAVTSRSVTLQKEQKDPLRVLATNTDACTPPAGDSMVFGAEIKVTFNEDIEFVAPNAAEEIDNGVMVTPSNNTSSMYCGLKLSTDPTRQERGTRATIAGRVLSLAFNPSVGFSTTSTSGGTCSIPPALTSVTYGNLANLALRPKGDASRRRTLGSLLAELPAGVTGGNTNALSCGRNPNFF